jgi:hypothetical protein
MNAAQTTGDLRSRLDAVILNESPSRVPQMVKAVLIESLQRGAVPIPPAINEPRAAT